MATIKVYALWALILLSWSCNENSGDKMPNESIIVGHEVKENQILYQYYEKFGFTDVCTHARSYFIAKNFALTDEWKQLPILEADRSKINSIPNKVDSLQGDSFPILYGFKDFFSDISLASEEFIRDTIFERKIDLTIGYYRIGENTFEIYSSKSNTIYCEYHSCDFPPEPDLPTSN